MSERTLQISLGVVTTVCIAAGGAAIKAYFDVQHMKEQLAKGISGERIAKIEGQLETHEATVEAKSQGYDNRLNDLVGRVTSLERSREWQRSREAERSR